MWIKRFVVWGLVTTCTVCDQTFRRWAGKVLPESFWDSDARWISWVFACNLASLSAELDDRWHTGYWTAPTDRFSL